MRVTPFIMSHSCSKSAPTGELLAEGPGELGCSAPARQAVLRLLFHETPFSISCPAANRVARRYPREPLFTPEPRWRRETPPQSTTESQRSGAVRGACLESCFPYETSMTSGDNMKDRRSRAKGSSGTHNPDLHNAGVETRPALDSKNF